ncbi:MAG: hypothetical protein EBX40_07845 [Gammaproteobacteria bacterium]|nr:hypothetical protein [Gammaproteobacteria bacterium]
MYREKILDIRTGKETWRDYTSEEIAEVEKSQAELAATVQVIENRKSARKSALAKLGALGLTEEEIAAL